MTKDNSEFVQPPSALEEDKPSQAYRLLVRRKMIVRELQMIPHDDPKHKEMRQEARRLMEEAQKAGGISTEEAYALALVH